MLSAKPRRSAAWSRALDAVAKTTTGGLMFHGIYIGNRRTSVRLDAVTWNALREIAAREQITVRDLCRFIAEGKPRALSLTVSLRCYALRYFMIARAGARRTVR